MGSPPVAKLAPEFFSWLARAVDWWLFWTRVEAIGEAIAPPVASSVRTLATARGSGQLS